MFSIENLTVYSGEKIGIIGENGIGKSTLLDIIAGRIAPQNGQIKICGTFAYITQQLTDISEENHVTPETYHWQIPHTPHSGGEITRTKIANGLATDAELLLCDEPTSNLDEDGIKRLEQALINYNGAVFLVSHDRMLMDKVCTTILEISNQSVKTYSGNYSDFKAQKENERQNQKKEYDKYIQTKKNLERAFRDRNEKSKGMKEPPKRMGNSEARLHRMDVRQRAGKVSNVAKKIKDRLERLDVKEKVKTETLYNITIDQSTKKRSKVAIGVRDLNHSYGNRSVLNDVTFSVKRGDKLCLTGNNGSGKTTLLNCIVREVDSVSINPSDEVGYFTQNGLALDETKTVLDLVMRYSKMPEYMTRTVLAELGIKDEDVFKQIRILSGGEKSKVALAKLLCRQCSILILDEPTNYLDIYILEALENMLLDYDGTLVFVSHDRRFREKIADRTLHLSDGRLEELGLRSSEAYSNRNAEILLLEIKATQLIEKKKGLSETQQEVIEIEYQQILDNINPLKEL